MIRRCTDEDFPLIDKIMKDTSIWDFISDDACDIKSFSTCELLGNENCYLLLSDHHSIFLFIPANAIMFDAHVCILPEARGPMAVENSILAYQWMFNETSCRKIMVQIPCFNHKAFTLAVRCGFQKEGINKKSFLKNGTLYDQIIMGLCKEEVVSCPQR